MADTAPHDPATDGDAGAASPYGRFVHWIKLVSGAIVGLAALLGAIAVIVDLVDKDPKPVVAAKFSPLEVTATTLDDFQATQKFTSAALPRVQLQLAAATTLAQEDTDQQDTGQTETEETQPCPSQPDVDAGATIPEGCPDTGQPCPTAAEVSELRVDVPPGCPDPGLDCPTAGEIAAGASPPAGCPVEGAPDETDGADPDQAARELGQQYDMGRGCSDDPTASRCALQAVAESAAKAPGSTRAERLVRVRRILAGTRTLIGADGKRRPMGMMVSIDVTLTGMSGERVDVYWSMLSASTKRALPQSWLRNTRAATLRPRAEQDQLQKDIWLPLPRERGRYRARVTLIDESDRHFAKRSEVFR